MIEKQWVQVLFYTSSGEMFKMTRLQNGPHHFNGEAGFFPLFFIQI